MHPLGRAAVASTDPAHLLDELKRIAVEQLGAIPGDLYRPIAEQLQAQLALAKTQLSSIETQRVDLANVLALRQRSASLVMRYRELIAHNFDDFHGRPTLARPGVPLGLVGEDELGFHLAGQRLAESIDARYQVPLELLGMRFEALATALGAQTATNPVGALRLAGAFVRTFHDAEVSETLQALLFQQYELELSKVLGDLYSRLNQQLVAGGFHANLRVDAIAPTPAQRPAPVTGPHATQAYAGLVQGSVATESVQPHDRSQDNVVGHRAPQHATSSDDHVNPGRSRQQAATDAGIDVFRVSAEARVQHQRLRELLHAWRLRNPKLETAATEKTPARPLPPRPLNPQLPSVELQSFNAARTPSSLSSAGPDPLEHAAATPTVPQALPATPRRELRTQELTSVAALLQRDSAWVFEAALSGNGTLHAAIRHQLMDGARSLGIDPESIKLGEHEEDAIDMVGLMFEALLDTHALVAPVRKLYAQLVMSYVRIAITDENLFVRPDHPARRLLDALTLSCESNDGASPQERELLQRAGQTVAHVVAEFNEDLAIFDLAANELQDLLQQQRRRAEVVERRSADTVHGRERLLQARLQAAAALAQRTSARLLTPVTAQFLEQHWQHHLVQMLLRDGQGSQRCTQVLGLADALVSVDEAAARAEGGRVAQRVLALHAGLVDCLSSSGLDDQVAGEWMAGLARAMAFPDASRDVMALPVMPQLADDGEDARLLQVVGGHAAHDFDPVVAERLATLRPGCWLRLADEKGEEGSVKVAWISPLTSRLLLVNRRGLRKLVASPQQLAALVKAGKLSDNASDLPFDEAMRHVRQRLDETARAA
jgi:hypothetical protein